MARAALEDEVATVRALCRTLGLGEVAPVLLKAAHHSSLLLPPLGIVARVQSAEPFEPAWGRAVREVAVARHLAGRDAPVLPPLEERLAGPHAAGAMVVTLWPFAADACPAGEADAALAAATLASVHAHLADYQGDLPPFTEALDRCWRVVADPGSCPALPDEDRALLKTQYRRLRGDVAAAGGRHVALHGDVHLGNLLTGGGGPLWIDFEDACLGPREYDIAGLPPEAWPLFPEADPALVARFAELRSVTVAIWCWADPARSAAVREAADHHLQRVRLMC